jgi:hypothetical protein
MTMIREAIKKKLKEQKISARKCALENGIIYQNFNSFLNGKRPLPLHEIEEVFEYLGLKIG